MLLGRGLPPEGTARGAAAGREATAAPAAMPAPRALSGTDGAKRRARQPSWPPYGLRARTAGGALRAEPHGLTEHRRRSRPEAALWAAAIALRSLGNGRRALLPADQGPEPGLRSGGSRFGPAPPPPARPGAQIHSTGITPPAAGTPGPAHVDGGGPSRDPPASPGRLPRPPGLRRPRPRPAETQLSRGRRRPHAPRPLRPEDPADAWCAGALAGVAPGSRQGARGTRRRGGGEAAAPGPDHVRTTWRPAARGRGSTARPATPRSQQPAEEQGEVSPPASPMTPDLRPPP